MADKGVENTGIDALENFERALSHVRKRYVITFAALVTCFLLFLRSVG